MNDRDDSGFWVALFLIVGAAVIFWESDGEQGMNDKKITTDITLGDIGRTVLRIACYVAAWIATLWVVRKEITVENVTALFVIATCWVAWVNNTRMSRVFKEMEEKR